MAHAHLFLEKIPCIRTRGKSKKDPFEVFKEMFQSFIFLYIYMQESMNSDLILHHHHTPAWKLANTK